MQEILISPCHQAELYPDDRWNSQQPKLLCEACGEQFHSHAGVYDFRLASSKNAVPASFEIQWRRYRRGEFEHRTLYGADARHELVTALDALGIDSDAVAGSWILDAGCGSGRLGNSLARLGANLVSLDFADSVRLVARGSRMANLHCVQADLMHPPLRPGAFDYVWSAGVLHHMAAARDAFDRLVPLGSP